MKKKVTMKKPTKDMPLNKKMATKKGKKAC